MAEKKKEKKKDFLRVKDNVEIKKGFLAVCVLPTCGITAYADDKKDAEAWRETHIDMHKDYERVAAKYLKSDDAANNPKALDLCPGEIAQENGAVAKCGASIGQMHLRSCDMAVCKENGMLRRSVDHLQYTGHSLNCTGAPWNGYARGEKEAAQYGISLSELFTNGKWDPDFQTWFWEPTSPPFGLPTSMPESPSAGTAAYDASNGLIVVYDGAWWTSDPKILGQYGYRMTSDGWKHFDPSAESADA